MSAIPFEILGLASTTDGTGAGKIAKILGAKYVACYASCAAQPNASAQWVGSIQNNARLFGVGAQALLGPFYVAPGNELEISVVGAGAAVTMSANLWGLQSDEPEDMFQLPAAASALSGPTSLTLVEGTFTDVKVTGLTGAQTVSRYVGATMGGPPVAGTFQTGDWIVDETAGFPLIWICTAGGTPGTWSPSTNSVRIYDAVMASTPSVRIPASGSLPTIGKHLEIEYLLRSDQAVFNELIALQFNGDVAAHYCSQRVVWNGATNTASDPGVAQTNINDIYIPGTSVLANGAGWGRIRIPFYNDATLMKSARALWGQVDTAGPFGGAAGIEEDETMGVWNQTAAITSMLLFPANGTFASGEITCTMTL